MIIARKWDKFLLHELENTGDQIWPYLIRSYKMTNGKKVYDGFINFLSFDRAMEFWQSINTASRAIKPA